jgi:Ca-activated chloride channel homolog
MPGHLKTLKALIGQSLPLLTFTYRTSCLILLAFGLSSPVFAWEWTQLWSNINQQASQAFTQEKYPQAAFLFEDAAWRAAANYRQGDYEASLSDLADLNDINSLYNRGNALAMLYRLNEAIDIYRRVLTIDPDHEAAANNLEVVAALQARLADDPGMDIEMDREEGEDAEDLEKDESQEITGLTNGQENEQNQKDTSESISQQDSQEADGNNGNSQLEDPGSAEEQEFKANLEQELSLQQWLGRIKDDPATLLKNKFELQRKSDSEFGTDLLALKNNQQLW